MSIDEPGVPYFFPQPEAQKRQPWRGAHLTSTGNYRRFPCTIDSPHESWCLHFEWGPCNCAPDPGEVFEATGTVDPPRRGWWR